MCSPLNLSRQNSKKPTLGLNFQISQFAIGWRAPVLSIWRWRITDSFNLTGTKHMHIHCWDLQFHKIWRSDVLALLGGVPAIPCIKGETCAFEWSARQKGKFLGKTIWNAEPSVERVNCECVREDKVTPWIFPRWNEKETPGKPTKYFIWTSYLKYSQPDKCEAMCSNRTQSKVPCCRHSSSRLRVMIISISACVWGILSS